MNGPEKLGLFTVAIPNISLDNPELFMGGANPTGQSIKVTQKYLALNEQPWIPIMGEFHFSRYPDSKWELELRKMKAGGITVAATYLFWIHIEEIEGKFIWGGNNNIRKFVELCQKVGLYAYLRIGPWAHGECRNGGFPDWLLQKCGKRTRQDAYPYLDYVRRFYTEIYKQVDGLLWKNGGPIIGIQLENELLNNAPHISTLKRLAQEIGFDVPLYTMTGWGPADVPENEVIPVFGGYPDAFWDRHVDGWSRNSRKGYFFSHLRDDNTIGADLNNREDVVEQSYLGNYPYGTCEIGGGMQVSYHRRPFISPDDIAALAMVKIGSGSNLQGYYMYHGGSNPIGQLSTMHESQETGYPNDLPVIDYDFQAPIGEYGQVRETYHLLRKLHLFLNDFGQHLATYPMHLPDRQPVSLDDRNVLRWAVRSDGVHGFLFINNYQRIESLPDHEDVRFSIRLQNETIDLPSQPVTIPSGSYMIWPVNLEMEGGLLKYATCQPVCRLSIDLVQYYVFSANDGIAPEFAFSADSIKIMDGQALIQETVSGITLVKNLLPGRDSLLKLQSNTGQEFSILILSESDARQLNKVVFLGNDYLALCPDCLISDDNGLSIFSSNEQPIFSIFPTLPDHFSVRNFKTERINDGIFTSYKIHLPIERPAVHIEHIKESSGNRTCPIGPAGVAQAPTNEEFSSADTWKINLPDSLFITKTSDHILEIRYTGASARLYLSNELIEDDFYSGRPWQIGLSRFLSSQKNRPEIRGNLEIRILPLEKNAPIYLPDFAWPDFGDKQSLTQINSVLIKEIYEIRVI